jgi:catechol 2,3-dioxygenase-like lactoylglutathione lyase family enzyme
MRFTPLFAIALASVPAVAAKHAADPPRITGVAGIAYDVTDLNKARAYYEGFLGFEEAGAIKNPDGTDHAAFVKINDHQYIELIQEQPTNHGYLHGAMFQTNNAEGMRELLKSKGIPVPDKLTKDAAGNLGFDVTDPSGFDLEVVQYLPNSLTGKSHGKDMPAGRISDHVDHIGLLVNDRDESTQWYTDNFGFTKEGDGSKMVIGSGPDRFELGVDKRNRTIDRYHVKDHLCLSVPDVPKVTAELNAKPQAKDYRTIESHQLPNGKHVDELYGPDGNRIELMEPPKPGASDTSDAGA